MHLLLLTPDEDTQVFLFWHWGGIGVDIIVVPHVTIFEDYFALCNA